MSQKISYLSRQVFRKLSQLWQCKERSFMLLCNKIRLQEYIDIIGFASLHEMEKVGLRLLCFSLMSTGFPYVER